MVEARTYSLLLHRQDERDKNITDGASSSDSITYCLDGHDIRGTRVILMLIAALPYYLFLHGHNEKNKNNTDGGNRLSPIAYCCTWIMRETKYSADGGSNSSLLIIVAWQVCYLLLTGMHEREKNNADGGNSSTRLLIFARA